MTSVFKTLVINPTMYTFDLSNKSLLTVAGVAAAGATAIGCIIVVRRYTAIGPYPSANKHDLHAKAVQRFVQDITRRNLHCAWFVGESLLTTNPRRNTENGHAASGSVRDEARILITSSISAHGWKRCEISPSGMSKNNHSNIVQHFAPSDLKFPVSDDIFADWDVLVGIDVDYYIDSVERYLELGKPTIWYTFNPLEVSGNDSDCRYRIVDNQVLYEVGGGGEWMHHVWNWCAPGEFIEVPVQYSWGPWFARFFGLEKVVYHKVYHSRPWPRAPHRAIVWTVPEFSLWRFRWAATDIHARRLRRVEYTDKLRSGWNTIVAPKGGLPGGDLMISLGRAGEDASVLMKKADFDIIMGLTNNQAVTTRLLGMKYTDPGTLALVGQYHRNDKAGAASCDSIVSSAVFNVHWPYAIDADVPEPSHREYTSPIVDSPNLGPMVRRWEVLSESLERRVTFVKNEKRGSKWLEEQARDFIALVCPEQGVGVPLDPEAAAAELDKPSQVLAVKAIWDTLDVPGRQLIESFVKNEPTMKCGRIISSFADARFLLMFSRYTLAFRNEVLHAEHNRHWFIPGNTPREIARMVCEYASSVDGVIEGDYSNFDGTVSSWLQRHVMNAVYHRYFPKRNHEELMKFTSQLITCPARAKKFGFHYDAGVGVKSGSPTTCDLNTVLNAFTMYAAVRATTDACPELAFRSIGMAFGDDSLFEVRFKKQWVRIVEQLGMSLKVETCKLEQGITFLARVFPDPLNTTTSFQDPLRTWRKLHMTGRDPNVPLEDAARDRLTGYLEIDPHTPITSDYCRMVLRLLKPETSLEKVRRITRKDRNKEKPYWLTNNDSGAWPQKLADKELMRRCIAERTGFSIEQLITAETHMQCCSSFWTGPILAGTPQDYAFGVQPDGGTAEPVVDDVLVTQQRDVNHQRANRGNGEGRGLPRNPDRQRGGPGGQHRVTEHRQDAQGPHELHVMPEQSSNETVRRNRRAPRETRPEQGAGSRRGGGGGRQPNARTGGGGVPTNQVRGQRQEPPAARRPRRPEAAPRREGGQPPRNHRERPN